MKCVSVSLPTLPIYTPFSRRNYEFRELDSYPASVMQVYRVVLKIPARFREWMAEMLHHSAILEWAA